MNISSVNNTAANLTSVQNTKTPAANVPQTQSAVEQRAVKAPQPVGEGQQAQKNKNDLQQQPNQAVQKEALEQAAQKISAHLNFKNASLEFSVDQSSGRNVVKIIDKATKETLRQIPSEEAIHIAEALDELDEIRQGLLLSAKG